MAIQNNTLPLISIIIPSYNHGVYIEKALQSLLSQTYTNWEAVVVDNYSTDDTNEILAKIIDPRFKIVKIHNKGVIAKSRNLGIKNATGQWIAFLDSDDFWNNDKLEKCSQYFETADFIYHKLRLKFENFTLLKCIRRETKGWPLGSKPVINLITLGNSIATSSVIVKREIVEQLGGFDESPLLVAAEDFDLWVRIAKNANRFKYISSSLGVYFITRSSVSRKNMGSVTLRVIKKHEAVLCAKEKNIAKSIVRYIRGQYFFRGENYYRSYVNLLYCLNTAPFTIRIKSLITILAMPFFILWIGRSDRN